MSSSSSSSKLSSIDVQGIRWTLNEVPSLRTMSSYKIVLTLWHDILDVEESEKKEEQLIEPFCVMYGEKLSQSVMNLARLSDDTLKEIESRYVLKIGHRVDCWMEYTRSCTVPVIPIFVFRTYLRFCVWTSNGEINYKLTAEKLLTECDFDAMKMPKYSFMSTEMGEFEQFSLLSKYAWAEYMDQVDENDLSHAMCFINWKTSPLLYYWLCYKRNDLKKIPLKRGERLEAVMLTRDDVNNWHIIEYFWSRFSDENKSATAIELLKKYESWRFQKPLLISLNDDQLGYVLTQMPVEIVLNFWLYLYDIDAASLIVTRVQHLLKPDQFAKLLQEVLQFRHYMDEQYAEALIKLWNTVSERRRVFFLTYYMKVIAECYFSSSRCNRSRSLEFLCLVLAHPSVGADYKKKLMLERGFHMAIMYDCADLAKVIEVCLTKPEDVAQFKKNVIESPDVKKACPAMVKLRGEQYVDKFVNFYTPSADYPVSHIKAMFSVAGEAKIKAKA